MLKIAIIVGSTRPGRNSEAVARWAFEIASQRSDAAFELVDIADFNLPLLDEPVPPAMGPPTNAHTQRWATVIDAFDAYVFVTPEYNHGPPGALKNAIDFLYREWHDKAAGFVSFGVAQGSCAVEQLRLVVSELRMADIQMHVGLSLIDDFESFITFKPRPQRRDTLQRLLDQLVDWATALREVRVARARTGDVPKADVRPELSRDADSSREAGEAVTRFVAGLQAGIDHQDAELYNRHFAGDVMWGSPYGQTVRGYTPLHAIHSGLLAQKRGGPASRYEVESVLSPTPDVVVAHIKRVALDAAGEPLTPSSDTSGAFSEMALYVLIRSGGAWWLAAAQNTPVRPRPGT